MNAVYKWTRYNVDHIFQAYRDRYKGSSFGEGRALCYRSQAGGKIHAAEKVAARVDVRTFAVLDSIPDVARGEGGILCMADDVLPLTAMDRAIGVRYL